MEFLLEDLSREDIQKLIDSEIDWYPDDMMDESTVLFETEEEINKAIELLGINNK